MAFAAGAAKAQQFPEKLHLVNNSFTLTHSDNFLSIFWHKALSRAIGSFGSSHGPPPITVSLAQISMFIPIILWVYGGIKMYHKLSYITRIDEQASTLTLSFFGALIMLLVLAIVAFLRFV